MATKTNRLGETRIMSCDMEATIIRYNGVRDIDVRFEDGAMAKHKAYDSFKKGKIANPNIKASVENRLGETRMMNYCSSVTQFKPRFQRFSRLYLQTGI